jgi:hypothetical protein
MPDNTAPSSPFRAWCLRWRWKGGDMARFAAEAAPHFP